MSNYLQGYIVFNNQDGDEIIVDEFSLEQGFAEDGIYIALNDDLRVEITVLPDGECRIDWDNKEKYSLDPIDNPNGYENLK